MASTDYRSFRATNISLKQPCLWESANCNRLHGNVLLYSVFLLCAFPVTLANQAMGSWKSSADPSWPLTTWLISLLEMRRQG